MSIRMKRHGRHRMGLTALEYAHGILESLDTPRSLAVHLLLNGGEYDQIVRLPLDPLDYDDPALLALDLQATKLLAKYPFPGLAKECRRAAVDEFLRAERKCQVTNNLFRLRSDSQFAFTGEVESVLRRSELIIANLLGPVPDLGDLHFRFGPGANLGVRGDTSVLKKLESALECTYAFSHLLPEFLGEFPAWISGATAEVTLVSGSELTFVPKNAKTDRPICIEPLLNGLYQKGIGSFLRDRLLRHGIDLRDQRINQRLAQKAITHGLSTVDLKSASDTISYAVVMDLLPVDWFSFLEIGRSPCYRFEGNWYPFQKFSSMGNAYTFELETLIFYSIARASCEALGVEYRTGETLHVFGDDVVIPNAAFGLFSRAAEAIGFEVNRDKSFSAGSNFFESCGADFFRGYFVRPIYFDSELKTLTEQFYAINSIMEISITLDGLPQKGGVIRRVQGRLCRLYRNAVRRIPRGFLALGPRNAQSPLGFREGVADSYICTPLDIALPYIRRHPSWCGWLSVGYASRSRRVSLSGHEFAGTAYACYHADAGDQVDGFGFRIGSGGSPPSAGYDLRSGARITRTKRFHHKWDFPFVSDEVYRLFRALTIAVNAQ